MSLKFKCKSKEEVPTELQSLYVERDGAFVLDVEGVVDRARVEEVRASNIALTSQLAEQKRRFEGIESEQVKAIAAERDTLNARLTAIQVEQGGCRIGFPSPPRFNFPMRNARLARRSLDTAWERNRKQKLRKLKAEI
jgi:hypothetical protein